MSDPLDTLAALQAGERPPAPALNGSGPPLAELLEEIGAVARRFVVLSDAQRDVVALWVVHAHAIMCADTTPYLGVSSPEKRSGKSRLLEVLAQLVPRPLEAANISEAALFRAVGEEGAPATVLFDEVDAIFSRKGGSDNDDLRGLINAGYRRGARAYRCVGEGAKQKVVAFPVFGAKALAGIGDLPETVADRSIPIRLHRRSRTEPIERGRYRAITDACELLRAAATAWAAAPATFEELVTASPELPDELDDRAQDGAEPLLAIADLAGESWPARARDALVDLFGQRPDEADSWGVQLLAGIRKAFEGEDRLATEALLEKLHEDEEAPWRSWNKGNGLKPRGMANLLRPYEIRSRSLRISGGFAKGYYATQFEDVFARYLPSGDVLSVTPVTTALTSHKRDFSYTSQEGGVTDRKRPKTRINKRM